MIVKRLNKYFFKGHYYVTLSNTGDTFGWHLLPIMTKYDHCNNLIFHSKTRVAYRVI